MDRDQILYNRNIESCKQQLKALTRRSNIWSLLRLIVILGGATLIFQIVQTENIFLTLISFFLTFVLFLILVRCQSQNTIKKAEVNRFLIINSNELHVAESIEKNIYDSGNEYIDDQHIYSSDLDIFGSGSVYQMINRCSTLEGRRLLSSWLSKPANKFEIEERQQFIDEVFCDFPWWQNLQAKLFAVKEFTIDAKDLISKHLVNEIQFTKSKLLILYTRFVPYIFIALTILSLYNSVFVSIITCLAIFNLLLSGAFSKQVNRVSSGLSRGGELLAFYAPVIKTIEQRAWKSKKAYEFQKKIEAIAGMPVSKSIERLSVLLDRLDVRLNIVVGVLLNIFLLWDFRQVYALQKWQLYHSKGILEALDMLTLVEVVGSLATLRFNNHTWTVPQIVNEYPTLNAKNIKHPLIPTAISVANDYSLDAHRIALITGSNMAGKSTFLRTIGVNAVLALCGSVVCADRMTISVMQIATYMRIKDSLNESTSTFKAELDRVQKVLGRISQDTFILLDEMLRGTNSTDKYLGSKAIIEKIIREHGVGMIATHDLKLSELSEQYPQIVENFHFDIQVEGDEMLFDYKLRKGPCTTFNASLLLKKIGIEI